MLVFSQPNNICWRDNSFLLNAFGFFVKNQMTINVRVYLWILNSVPPICMSVLIPVPHCLDDHGFSVSFEIRKCESNNLFFFKIIWLFRVLCLSTWTSGSAETDKLILKFVWKFKGPQVARKKNSWKSWKTHNEQFQSLLQSSSNQNM